MDRGRGDTICSVGRKGAGKRPSWEAKVKKLISPANSIFCQNWTSAVPFLRGISIPVYCLLTKSAGRVWNTINPIVWRHKSNLTIGAHIRLAEIISHVKYVVIFMNMKDLRRHMLANICMHPCTEQPFPHLIFVFSNFLLLLRHQPPPSE